MKRKKYGFALLMICLIICTILLSVKHEQKRREKMAVQEEEPSEEMPVQAEEETVTGESEITIEQEEAESEKKEILYEHTLPGDMWMYYESEEIPFLNRETGKKIYIKDWTDSKGRTMVGNIESLPYYFFDMNEDGLPELCIDYYGVISVFTYDAEMDICILWTWISGMELAGTRKGVWNPDYDSDIYEYFQLDLDGDLEINTLFWAEHADWYHYDINMVMFPNYADSEKRCEITEEMEQQGVFEESSGQWFFRITDEQFEELAKPYKEGLKQARERQREERYTYEELFGEYETAASDSVDYVDEELYAEIKDICKNIDFTPSFDPGDVTKYDLYKEKFKEFMDGERTVWIKETGEELYIYEIYCLEKFRTAIELGEYDIDRYRYYFFDINGDKEPELCIMNDLGYIYVFQYNEERDQIVLWKEYISNSIFLMGTQKLGFAGGWSGDGMIRVDENGDRVFIVVFKVVVGGPYRNDMGDNGYLVFLPEYIELREDMLEQAIYDKTDEQYCFRVTEEQFEELIKDYDEAVNGREAALDAVTYTYTELFD